MLMQSWSDRSVGHIKFDPRAHVNHQQEDVKDELDVTLVYGERDFEDTKTGMLCDFKGGLWWFLATVQQPNFHELRQPDECIFV